MLFDFLPRHESHHDAARSADIQRPDAVDLRHEPELVLRRDYIDMRALQPPRADKADSFLCPTRQLIQIGMAHLAQAGIRSANEQWARQYNLVASAFLNLTDQSPRTSR